MGSRKDAHGDARAALKQGLCDLRMSFHQALIRRLRGTRPPPQELRSWILEDTSDARVFERVRARDRGPAAGKGEGIMTRISRFMVRLRWPWRT